MLLYPSKVVEYLHIKKIITSSRNPRVYINIETFFDDVYTVGIVVIAASSECNIVIFSFLSLIFDDVSTTHYSPPKILATRKILASPALALEDIARARPQYLLRLEVI